MNITRRQATQLLLAPIALQAATPAAEPPPPATPNTKSWKILLVVAHPDDEYYFAATVYRLAQELNATVDQVVITNGEGGYRYSALAEKIYGVKLTDETTGRTRLPEIRRRETLAAGRILGVRRHYFFGEKDERFTLEADEALNKIWNCSIVRRRLETLLEEESYDFIFTLLPRESTHGHHQAATLLALETAAKLSRPPVVLAAEPGHAGAAPEPFTGLPHFDASHTATAAPEFAFDRRQSFGYQDALRYDIVVQWVIAEHKSQGMFQNDVGKHDIEYFWRFTQGPAAADAGARTHALAAQLIRKESPAAHAESRPV